MPITPLPTPPNRSTSPATFSDDGDRFLGALPTFATQANDLAADVNSKQSTTTAAAATATSKAAEATTAASGANSSATLASQWATKTGSTVASNEYSAKEYAAGDAVESAKRHASGTVATGSAKDWATKSAGEVVAGQGFSAKKYATDAGTAASIATTKAGEAASSASSISSSVSTATAKAGEAAASASSALASANTATTKAGEAASSASSASTSASTATTKAGEAASSASSASTSASTATTKADEAAASATSAGNSATTATTKASEAAASASSVLASANTATTKASEAASSATSALASASTATTKAGEALSSATLAATSASTATTKADEAASSASSTLASASTATTKAGEAASSASSASASASTASTKADEATSSASSALASASTATTKASEAAASAAAAAASAAEATAPVEAILATKVDKVAGKGLSTEDYTSAEKDKLAGIAAGAQVNTVTLVAGRAGDVVLTKDDVGLGNVDNISDVDKPVSTATQAALDAKVDKVVGKQLSTEDYTTAEKTKLASVEDGANAYTHPANHPPSIITQDENNRFVTDAEKAEWNAKQAALVSGTNIKMINGESLLGGGNLVVSGSGGGGPTLQGDTAPHVNQSTTYQITNYNSFSSYAVSASAGTASISGDTITYITPAATGNVNLTLTVDGQPTEFTVSVQPAPPYIPTPTPTPANFGDPLEGGFYAGMIWNQLAQSATSMAIATGSKTFSVPSMLVAPIVYQGQMVEVRSRTNPANRFDGTVTSVNGANLTINVTSIGGSGTFSDWSIMARHRVIVAPKASGEHAGIALKNVQMALPTACQTLTEGFAATQAMCDADSSTVYPAAHWARNLDIGGRTDWYIPARDELELCWRNLKPVTGNNYVTANRPTSASFNYANNGSYGDTANTHGLNNNSAPIGAAYTAAVPAQTTAAAFRTGVTEAYEFGSTHYWSSSDYNATTAWVQYWVSSFPGGQGNVGKTNASRVRAVRRSVI